jgi:hypothetical protein
MFQTNDRIVRVLKYGDPVGNDVINETYNQAIALGSEDHSCETVSHEIKKNR